MKNSMKVFFVISAVSICLGSCGGAVSETQTSSEGKSTGGTGVTIKLPKTGQTTQYAVGDDGNLQNGVAWPPQRFTDNGSTVTDKLTGLMWLKDANCIATNYPGFDADGGASDGAVTWQHALDFVKGINSGTYQNCGAGYNDWRLPNRNEIRSLINYEVAGSSVWLTTYGFANVKSGSYWSSSTYIHIPSIVFIYGFNRGYEFTDYKSNFDYVWPVRSTGVVAFASVPKTGQTTCYDASGAEISCTNTGQDGDKKAGIDWPRPRFHTDADATIADNFTGLVWGGDAGTPTIAGATSTCTGGAMAWQNALTYIDCLNTNNYLGHNDWRLPNINELASLTHTGSTQETCGGVPCTSNADWLKTQGFSNVRDDYYWSSTTNAASTGYAYFVLMYNGRVGAIDKATFNYYVWPVRGGQ